MDRHRWKARLDQQSVQGVGSRCRLDKNDDLIELESVKQVYQLAILLVLLKLAEVLLQTVQCQACLVVDRDLKWLFHELLASVADLFVQCGRKHLYLLLVWCHLENVLDVSAHVKSFEHLVALIKDEMLQIACVEMFATDERQDSSRCAHYDCGRRLLQLLDMCLNRLATVHDLHRDLVLVHVLREAIVLLLNLEGKLASVAHHKYGDRLWILL